MRQQPGNTRPGAAGLLLVAAAAIWASATVSQAQEAAMSRADASVVAEGVVREVFRSDRQTKVDYVLLVELTRADLGENRRTRILVPAPGETIYVHTSERARRGMSSAVPEERAQVRLYLASRPGGGWDAVSVGGIELTSRAPAPSSPNEPEPPLVASATAPAPTPEIRGREQATSALSMLGMTAEALPVSGRLVLRVSDLRADGPAAQAGIEKGDVIVGVGEKPFASLEELAQMLRAAGPEATLAVMDVRSGKAVPVKVALAPAPVVNRVPEVNATAPAQRGTRTLGVGVTPVQVQGRQFLKVTEVDPGSAAAQAGIEPGDIIAGIEQKLISKPEELAAAVRDGGETITLVVLDARSGKAVPVPVEFGPSAASPTGVPAAPNLPQVGGAGAGRSLGVTTKQTIVKLVPALEVVRVEPNSPAARAGLEVGDVIFSANDVVTIVPDLLDSAVEKSGPTMKLSVLDPRTGRKTDVEVNLGR